MAPVSYHHGKHGLLLKIVKIPNPDIFPAEAIFQGKEALLAGKMSEFGIRDSGF